MVVRTYDLPVLTGIGPRVFGIRDRPADIAQITGIITQCDDELNMATNQFFVKPRLRN